MSRGKIAGHPGAGLAWVAGKLARILRTACRKDAGRRGWKHCSRFPPMRKLRLHGNCRLPEAQADAHYVLRMLQNIATTASAIISVASQPNIFSLGDKTKRPMIFG